MAQHTVFAAHSVNGKAAAYANRSHRNAFRTSSVPGSKMQGNPRHCLSHSNTWLNAHPVVDASRSVVLRAVRADQQTDATDTATVQLIAEVAKSVEDQVATVSRASTTAMQELPEMTDNIIRTQVKMALQKLEKGLLERDTEIRLLLLAALCGEHLLLLGPPGTAKSELARRLSGLVGGQYFERLLTRFSVPEELFGPLSMRGLENDEYVRQISGYLPTAEVAFVDEIFKANSAILNALLTLLNERLFDNGNKRFEVPLLSLVGASNELPESEELDALYDRFLIRRTVAQVSNGQIHKLARLAAGRHMEESPSTLDVDASTDVSPFNIEDFRTTADDAYVAVDVPDTVIDLLTSTRNYLQDKCEPPIYVSDRRFMKAVQFLQVVAHADGRSEVTEYDCIMLEHVFGNRPDDAGKVRSYVLETIASDPGLQQTELVFLGLFGRGLRVLGDASSTELAEARQEAGTLVDLLADRHKSLTISLDGGFPELRRTLWQSEGSMQASVQALTPQMTENRRKVEELLKEALTLKACLDRATSPALLERLLPKRYKQYQKGISGRA